MSYILYTASFMCTLLVYRVVKIQYLRYKNRIYIYTPVMILGKFFEIMFKKQKKEREGEKNPSKLQSFEWKPLLACTIYLYTVDSSL